MKRCVLPGLQSILITAILIASPPAFACSQCCTVCGPFCTQVLYDNYFDEDCAWEFNGGAQRVAINGNALAELDGGGSVSQVVSPASNNDLRFDLAVVAGTNPGTERIAVEVVSTAGTLLETIDIVTSAGTYTYDVGDYTSYGSIRIRFRMLMMPSPGDTKYRIDNVYFWIY